MLSEDSGLDGVDFWREHVLNQTLPLALKTYPDRAKRFFGAAPVSRGNLLELSMILGAREILATPSGKLRLETNESLDEQLAAALNELPDEQKVWATKFLSPGNQEELVRRTARTIIRNATGSVPPT